MLALGLAIAPLAACGGDDSGDSTTTTAAGGAATSKVTVHALDTLKFDEESYTAEAGADRGRAASTTAPSSTRSSSRTATSSTSRWAARTPPPSSSSPATVHAVLQRRRPRQHEGHLHGRVVHVGWRACPRPSSSCSHPATSTASTADPPRRPAPLRGVARRSRPACRCCARGAGPPRHRRRWSSRGGPAARTPATGPSSLARPPELLADRTAGPGPGRLSRGPGPRGVARPRSGGRARRRSSATARSTRQALSDDVARAGCSTAWPSSRAPSRTHRRALFDRIDALQAGDRPSLPRQATRASMRC